MCSAQAWDCPCDAVVVGAVEIQHRLLAGVPIQPGYAVEPGLNYRHIGCYVQAWDCVCDAAVVGAADILERMLAGTPSAVRQRLVAAGCDVAIIGRNQVGASIVNCWQLFQLLNSVQFLLIRACRRYAALRLLRHDNVYSRHKTS